RRVFPIEDVFALGIGLELQAVALRIVEDVRVEAHLQRLDVDVAEAVVSDEPVGVVERLLGLPRKTDDEAGPEIETDLLLLDQVEEAIHSVLRVTLLHLGDELRVAGLEAEVDESPARALHGAHRVEVEIAHPAERAETQIVDAVLAQTIAHLADALLGGGE